jgi:allantoinase
MALQVIKCVGLRIVQGSLEFGKDADIVIWDPEASFILDSNYPIFHKHKVTPYAGQTLSGKVIATFSRGREVFHEGYHAPRPCGTPLLPVH